ncbi:hypothetical protein PYCCODRAFT_1369755 [Trametes coccinea BRFM310]|uniref:Uncharacterized protein n=1 Tax=Trametes coccinea (strain BRFM310) TaxID=1353009 RepID=A0A1Y2IJG7_TRAC3|nr:hypothetical protein PYCCODRAFT_1369755 [Trametes coccinea BRFM310]
MPARTLPTSPDPALSPPRFHPRLASHQLSPIHARRDSLANDDPRQQPPYYVQAMPAQLVRLDTPASPSGPADQPVSHSGWSPVRVYPDPSSIPPHWQVYPAQQLRDSRPPLPPGTVMQGNSTQPPWTRAYPPGGYARVMQVQPFVAMPPPPIPHKVWILDCKTCGTFLTNRGMKAVLLLRPNVPLYSTDALPINCSAFSPPSEAPTHAPSSSISSSTSTSSSGIRSTRSSISGPSGADAVQGGHNHGQTGGGTSPERPPSRTCECLTQTLCCHGCGNAVGYMIVSPCQRCTGSITANNRSTNGHRFVFYSSEITACERHYVPGERGVTAFHPPPHATATVQSVQTSLAGMQVAPGTPTRQSAGQPQGYSPASSTSTAQSMPPLVSSPVTTVSPSGRRTSIDYIPPTVTDASSPGGSPVSQSPGNLSPSALAARSRQASSVQVQVVTQSSSMRLAEVVQTVPPVPPNSHSTSPHPASSPTFADPGSQLLPSSRARAASASAATTSASSSSSSLSSAASTPLTFAHPLSLQSYASRYGYATQPHSQAQPTRLELPPAQPLKAGEVLYWHHLLRSGEIPAVAEDPLARMDAEAQESARMEEERRWERQAKGRAVMRGLVAGR